MNRFNEELPIKIYPAEIEWKTYSIKYRWDASIYDTRYLFIIHLIKTGDQATFIHGPTRGCDPALHRLVDFISLYSNISEEEKKNKKKTVG